MDLRGSNELDESTLNLFCIMKTASILYVSLHGDSQTLATQITQWIFAKATMITMSIPLLQLRNVGHAEVLRIELHHLCTMQHLSTDVVHGNSNAKWVTLSHCGSLLSSTLFCFAMSAGACEVQTSVGFLFQIASLKISNDIRPPQNSSGITHPSLQYILKRILVSTCQK